MENLPEVRNVLLSGSLRFGADTHFLSNTAQSNVLSDFYARFVYIGGVGITERRNTHEKTSGHNFVSERICRWFLQRDGR